MSSIFTTESDPTFVAADAQSQIDILNRNTLITAGVLVGGSTVLASTALVAAALPVQIAVAGAATAGLIYAGDRQDKGLPVNPFTKTDTPATPEAVAQ